MTFGPRLLASLILTLVSMSAIYYGLSIRDIQTSLIKQSLSGYVSDAELIEATFRSDTGAEDSLDEVNEILFAIAHRPGVNEAVLVDIQGRVVAAHEEEELEGLEPAPNIVQVIETGESYGGPQQDSEDLKASPFEYLVPVHLAGDAFALEVDQKDLLLSEQRQDLRTRTGTTILLGLLLGIPLFYASGGRSISLLHKEAVTESERDSLTQLGNHRAFQEEIRRACKLAERSQYPLSLVLVDIDDFKQTNDRFGHQYGDKVLKDVGLALRSQRSSDRAFSPRR